MRRNRKTLRITEAYTVTSDFGKGSGKPLTRGVGMEVEYGEDTFVIEVENSVLQRLLTNIAYTRFRP